MKKTTRPAATDKPQGAQIDAIRRLAGDGKAQEARGRVAALRQRFPHYRPLLALAWEIEDQAGSNWGAAARAFDWAEAAPGSEAAQSALAESAFAMGLPALGNAAALQLARLRGAPAQPLDGVDTALGRMSGAEAVLADVSRLLLADGRYAEQVARLADASQPSLCNNRALARFALGDVAGALDDFEDNWRRHPLNVFALEHLVRLRMWRHGRAHAAQLAQPLGQSAPRRPMDALAKLNGLILLGEWDAAEAAFQADAPGAEMFLHNHQMRGAYAYAGSVLALRRGDTAAVERLRLARLAMPDHDPVDALDLALASAPTLAAVDCSLQLGEVGAWLPSSWIKSLSDLRGLAGPDQEARIRRCLAACDADADYLGLAAELGGETAGAIAIEVLKLRAAGGDPAAAGELVSLLARPCGPDRWRVRLLYWLGGEKLLGAAPTPLLADGAITEVLPRTFRLTPEPTADNPYRPAVQQRYEEMVGLLRRRQLRAALELALEICRLAPEVPMSHANLAMVKDGLGAPGAEVEALLRRALELDADYVFARAGLARMLAKRGEVDAANALLEPVLRREEFHYSEWRVILSAQRELALAQGRDDAVRGIDQSLRELAELEAARD